MKLSIIIPVFNEAGTVGAVIDKVRSVDLGSGRTATSKRRSSSSTTAPPTARAQALEPYEKVAGVRVHHSPVNLGKGSSVRIGFSFASGDIITIQDADLELDPAEYKHLIEPIVDGSADVVYGSRFIARRQEGQADLLDREQGAGDADQHAFRRLADRHRDLLQGLPRRRHPAAQAQGRALRDRARADRAAAQARLPHQGAADRLRAAHARRGQEDQLEGRIRRGLDAGDPAPGQVAEAELQRLLDQLFDLGLGHGADDLADHLAVLEHEQRRDRAHVVLRRRLRVLVDVDLADLDLAGVLAGQLLDDRRDRAARVRTRWPRSRSARAGST